MFVVFAGLDGEDTGAALFVWALLVDLAFDVVGFAVFPLLIDRLSWVTLAFFARFGDLVVVTASIVRLAPPLNVGPLNVGGMIFLLPFSLRSSSRQRNERIATGMTLPESSLADDF